MDELVCSCSGYTALDIERDARNNGRSTIAERILAEKAAGGCQCAAKNPKGRGCLADVRRVADHALQRPGGLPGGFGA